MPFHVSPTKWAFDVYDVATQAMSSNYVEVVNGRGEYNSIPFRYVWPAELDLMAELAGLRLRDRWAGWGRASPSPARAVSTSRSGKRSPHSRRTLSSSPPQVRRGVRGRHIKERGAAG